MVKQNKSTSRDILKPLKNFIRRFHLTFFVVFIITGLTNVILIINDTLQESSADPNYTSPINAGSIDEATLTRLNALHTSTQGTPAAAQPTGRINPVSE